MHLCLRRVGSRTAIPIMQRANAFKKGQTYYQCTGRNECGRPIHGLAGSNLWAIWAQANDVVQSLGLRAKEIAVLGCARSRSIFQMVKCCDNLCLYPARTTKAARSKRPESEH